MSEKFTPGPWRWEVNMKSKRIQLCGGKPQFDLTVMDFTRWGMNGARPRVLDYSDMKLLKEAEDFRVVIPGREHHASWLQGIDHPDMNLIAAAPDMYEALKALVEGIDEYDGFVALGDMVTARAALAKADGIA